MNKNSLSRHMISSRKVSRIIAAILVAASLTCTAPVIADRAGAASNFSNDSQVKKFENQLATIDQNLKNLKNEIATTKLDIANAKKNKTNLDNQISLLYDKIEVQSGLIAELEVLIDNKEVEIVNKQADYDRKYELFKQRLRVTHEDGDASYIAMLFGADSLSDFLSRVDRIGAMLDYDTRIMQELSEDRVHLDEEKVDFEERLALCEATAAQLRLDQAEIQRLAKEAENYIASLNADAAAQQKMQQENEKLRKELEAELEERIKELEKQNSKYVGGTLLWPVPVQYTRITSECGWRKAVFGSGQEYHNGADIPVPYGTDIYAANDGTVVTATEHWSYGKYIMIDHGGGIITLYAHNSKLLVKVGQKVKRGQVIAKAGSSGQSTGNHLHFSIRENGVWVNHRKYFKD